MRLLRASCVAALVLAGCAAAAPAGPPSQSEVKLPRVWPQRLALTSDGSLWATGQFGGVTRLDPSGRAKTFGIGRFNWAYDLVAGPDGALWMSTDDGVRRLDAVGHQTRWALPRGAWPQSITSAGGALWIADAAIPDRIDRVATDGTQQTFRIPAPRENALTPGITAGPDGALWFTQRGFFGDPPDGIGRMTPDGHSTSWALPHRRASPTRIAAGPDGALWFTERDGHAIGRITTSGAIREFPLRTGLGPDDIAAGADRAMWFTADGCIGRITTSGQITAWPVHGARRLLGIVAAADGSVWAADDIKSALWHFVPPADGAAPPAPCAPPTLTRRARSTSASLVYRREDTFRHDDYFSDPRIGISRGGKLLFAEAVRSINRRFPPLGDTASFAVRDLDGDREPEVTLELNLGGTHCCAWSRVYRYVRAHRTYRATVHVWGDDAASPRMRDLNRDGKPEFVSVDARFAYAFEAYAASFFPIQIWSFRGGRFRDVSRRFPAQVRRDAALLWRQYLHSRRKRGDETVRGILPAWAADEYVLGAGAAVWPTLGRAAAQGYLDCPAGGCSFSPTNPQVYIRRVRAFLRKTGYVR